MLLVLFNSSLHDLVEEHHLFIMSLLLPLFPLSCQLRVGHGLESQAFSIDFLFFFTELGASLFQLFPMGDESIEVGLRACVRVD